MEVGMNENIWLLLLLLLALLLGMLGMLLAWLRRHRAKEYQKHPCVDIPPDVARRPDPCLYSQPFLLAKGLAVTWDNPDIRITTPGGVLVPSSALAANTDYIVEATIHNASFDPALGVEVRCFYRPWSFGTPDRVPVEADASGDPAVRIVHIGAWGHALAKFAWHTPHVANTHFCLQVECFHPSDREPNNNLGQENTQVGSAASPLELIIPLFNYRKRGRTIRVAASEYMIPEPEIQLKLRQIRGYRGVKADDRKMGTVPGEAADESHKRDVARDAARGAHIRISPEGRRSGRGVGYRLFGYDALTQLAAGNAVRDFALRDGWAIEVDQAERRGDEWRFELAPRTSRDVRLRVQVPDDTPIGRQKAINIWATDLNGGLLGGVTVYVRKGA
jgi:hypothetical protein